MHLVLVLLERNEAPERAITRLRDVGIPDPFVLRARSTVATLSGEVPIFAGLRTLALGADEDRLVLVSLWAQADAAEVQRLITRVQLEMSADDPPSGRIVAFPVITSSIG
ncbi:MAG: hypothetical protein L0Y66_12885 [Myxococcaceae bacterium]|nr:hypothetical protein [Myxococcaceae bacterium]